MKKNFLVVVLIFTLFCLCVGVGACAKKGSVDPGDGVAGGDQTQSGGESGGNQGGSAEHSHNFVWIYNEDATCTEDGTETQHCLCGETGETRTKEGSKTGHNMQEVKGEPATCTQDGVIAHWHCENCERNFRDINGDTQLRSTVESKKGHSMREVKGEPATCTQDGVIAHWYCANCKLNFQDFNGETQLENVVESKKGHSMQEVKGEPATCTQDGVIAHWYCENCKLNFKDFNGETQLENVVESKKGHSMQEVKGEPATCTQDGVIEHWHCEGCELNFKDLNGETQLENVVESKKGHSMQEVKEKPATCTQDGVIAHWYCENCGLSFKDQFGNTQLQSTVESKKGHSMQEVKGEPATCTQDGVIAHWYCGNCGLSFKDQFGNTQLQSTVESKKGHSMQEVKGEPATCTQDGVIEHWHCGDCELNFQDFNGEIQLENVVESKKGHSMQEVKGKPATCTQDGVIEHWHCEGCELNFQDFDGEIQLENVVESKKGHSMQEVKGEPATCTQDGVIEHWHCEDCELNFQDFDGEIQLENVVESKKGHSMQEVKGKPATCTQDGVIAHWYCEDCDLNFQDFNGEILLENVVESKKGHSMQEVKEKPATCTQDGVIAHWHCKNCELNFQDFSGETQLENVVESKKGHSMQEVKGNPATCTQDGVIAHWHCENCKLNFQDFNGETQLENIVESKKGHSMQEVKGEPATCTQDGVLTHWYCENCKLNFKDQYGNTQLQSTVESKKGHSMQEVTRQSPTCSQEGVLAHWHCNRCELNFQDRNGDILMEDVSISKVDHQYQDIWTTDIEPTEEHVGQRSRHCKWCSERIESTEIPKLPYSDWLIYELDELTDTYIVAGLDKKNFKGTTMNITPEYQGRAVTAIKDSAFKSNSDLESVGIPKTITLIGDMAFGFYSEVKEVHISDILAWCKIDFKSYASNPLYYGAKLYLNGAYVTDLKEYPEITEIGAYAFNNYKGFTNLTIPRGLASVGNAAFQNCSELKEVHISDIAAWCKINFETESSNPLFNGAKLYLNGTYVTDLKEYSEITEISNYAFVGYIGFIDLTIPETVMSIGQAAFSDCNELTRITLSFIGEKRDNPENNFVGYIFGAYGYSTNGYLPDSLKTVVLTDITSIGELVFYDCKGLESIILPESVTSIGKRAFQYCSGLKSIIVPAGVTSIGQEAFAGCHSLTSITLPFVGATKDGTENTKFNYIFDANIPSSLKTVVITNATTIATYAFYCKNEITSITLPDTLTSVGFNAFYDCTDIAEVHISDIAAWSRINFDSYYANPLEYGATLYLKGSPVTDLKEYSEITEIGAYTFHNYTGFTNLTLPDGVTSIGRDAFGSCDNMTSILIPNSVTSIGQFVLSDCSSLRQITIPFVGATKDGNESFRDIFGDLPALKTIVITSAVSIGKDAFQNCSGIESISLPDSLATVGYNAFGGCSGLKEVHISDIAAWSRINFTYMSANPLSGGAKLYLNEKYVTDLKEYSEITEIRSYVFSGYVGFTDVTLPGSVTQIGAQAFVGCSGLESIVIPESVTQIGSAAFRDCSGLTSITVPFIGDSRDNATNLNFKYIFDGTLPTSLKTVIVTGGTTIASQAFSLCKGITSITLPDSVTSIGYSAFYGCSGLENINIPESVTSIGGNAFYNCSGLKKVYISDISAWCEINFGINSWDLDDSISSNPLSNGATLYLDETPITDLKEHTEITQIKAFAFAGYTEFTDLTIPDSVTSIGQSAFNGCNSLRRIAIPFTGATEEGQEEFKYIFSSVPASLTAVVLTRGASIKRSAFSKCSGIESITLPDSLTMVDYDAFSGCSGLKEVHISDIAAWCKIVFNSTSSNPLINGATLYLNGDPVTDLKEYSEITEIKTNAFCNYTGFTNLTIPANVTLIGCSAFSGCKLTSITLPFIGETRDNSTTNTYFGYLFGAVNSNSNASYVPASLKTVILTGVSGIQASAFMKCSSIQNITLSDGLAFIGSAAFEGCSGLESVVIPKSVTQIGSGAFKGCSGLESIVISEGVIQIGSAAFEGCSGLESIVIPESVTQIGSAAFKDCSGLTSITLPFIGDSRDNATNLHFEYIFDGTLPASLKNVILTGGTSLADDAFYGCSSLESITLPDGLASIGIRAFYGCSGLESMTIPDGLTSVGAFAFYGCSSLNEVHISGQLSAWCEITFGINSWNLDGSISSNPLSNGATLCLDGVPVTDLKGYSDLKEIKAFAFAGYTGFTDLTIPNNVTSIGKGAFYGCNGITSITLPFVGETRDGAKNTNLSYIFGAEFGSKDYSYQKVYIPASLKKITLTDSTSLGSNAFSSCSSLESINIPDSVTSIGDYAFSGCSSLREVHIPDIVAWCRIDFSSLTANPLSSGATLYLKGTPVTDLKGYSEIAEIKALAFAGYKAFVNLTIPENVTSIGKGAFSSCNELTSIALPFVGETRDSSNTHFSYIFSSIPASLTTVVLTGGATIKEEAFKNCKGITSITIPTSITSIANDAFTGCSGLKEVHIPDIAAWCRIDFASSTANPLSNGTTLYVDRAPVTDLKGYSEITEIKAYAFAGYTGFTDLTVPEGVTSIGQSAFKGCKELTCVILPQSLVSIGKGALMSCSGLEKITIPFVGETMDGATHTNFGYIFGDESFSWYSGVPDLLKTVVVTGGTTIANNAFRSCTNLTSITLPECLASIESDAFLDCGGLKEVHVSDITAWCRIDFASSTANPLSNGATLYVDRTPVTDLKEYTDLTEIKTFAFAGYTEFRDLTIPDSVTSIGQSAFSGCNNLMRIVIPFIGGTEEGSGKFKYIFSSVPASLKVVVLKGGTSIKNEAFYGCSGIESITIPKSVTSIGESAFFGCSGLKEVHISDIAAWCKIDFAPEMNQTTNRSTSSNPLKNGAMLYLNGDPVTDLKDYSEITEIKAFAFCSYVGFENLTVPENVTSIRDSAFYGCRNVTNIIIPLNVNTIERFVFRACNHLTSITLPFMGGEKDDVATYFGYIFGAQNASYNSYYVPESLKTVVILGGEESIGLHAFWNCRGLTDITIGDGVTSIENQAFRGCTGLKNITLPESLIRISAEAFYGCSSLESIFIPKSVTEIKTAVFGECSSLVNIEVEQGNPKYHVSGECLIETESKTVVAGCKASIIPTDGSVTSIGTCAFVSCTELVNFIIPANVTMIEGLAFEDCTSLTSITIPKSVTEIQRDAFKNCSNLKEVHISDVLAWCQIAFAKDGSINEGNCFSANPLSNGAILYLDGVPVTDLKDFSGITKIASFAFCNYRGFTSLELPEGVKTIGNYAFRGCCSLSQIVIPESVTSIGQSAFNSCYKLIEVWNKSGLPITANSSDNGYVAYYAKHVYTQNEASVLTQTEDGFVFYEENGESYLIGYNGNETVLTLPNETPNHKRYALYQCALAYSDQLTEVIIPEGVTEIGDRALYECRWLKKVTISGGSVTRIGDYAFYGCSRLENVTISGGSVTRIGDYAFYGCSGLESIVIPEGVTEIGKYAFENCSELESVVIPKGMAEIGWNAFENTSLKNIYFGGTRSEWRTIRINSSNTTFLKLTPYFYSAEMPSEAQWADSRYWWHFDEVTNEIVVWVKQT